MPVANYEDVFAGYNQAPGWMGGTQSQALGAHAEVAVPGLASVGGGVQATAPRVAGMLILAGAVLAALKVSGIRFNVGM